MSNEPAMSSEEAKATVATKTAPKVTEDSIRAKIESVKYLVDGVFTVCLITMKNGFIAHGVSAPASPENFDAQVGQTFAYKNAFNSLWALEGYLLREQLSEVAI